MPRPSNPAQVNPRLFAAPQTLLPPPPPPSENVFFHPKSLNPDHHSAIEYANIFRQRHHSLDMPAMHFLDYADYLPFTAADYAMSYSPSSNVYAHHPFLNGGDQMWSVLPMLRRKREVMQKKSIKKCFCISISINNADRMHENSQNAFTKCKL